MGINWKQREQVFRLVVAIYAELGEESFKGRYGNIAKRFGPDATYDAIKSFFAKEISRAVQQNEIQYLGQAHSPEISRRPPHLHLDEDEDEITVLSDQQVTALINNQLQKSATDHRKPGFGKPPTDTPTKIGIPAAQASSSLSANRTRMSFPTQELVGDHEPRPPKSNLPDLQLESFGYVTNQGEYRCALCMSQLTSQGALEQHESMSKLHLRNLRNPTVVSKGRANLNLVTGSANNLLHQATPDGHSRDPSFSPSSSLHMYGQPSGETPNPSPELSMDVRNGKRRAHSILVPPDSRHQPTNDQLHPKTLMLTAGGSDSEAPQVQHLAKTVMSVRKTLEDCYESLPEVFSNASHEVAVHSRVRSRAAKKRRVEPRDGDADGETIVVTC